MIALRTAVQGNVGNKKVRRVLRLGFPLLLLGVGLSHELDLVRARLSVVALQARPEWNALHDVLLVLGNGHVDDRIAGFTIPRKSKRQLVRPEQNNYGGCGS